MLVIMPPGSVAKKDVVKHAISDRALCVSVKELQLRLPGASWHQFGEVSC